MKRNTDKTFECADCLGTYDKFYEYVDHYCQNLSICENCWNTRFEVAVRAKDKEWFLNNFNHPEIQFPKLKFLGV